MKYKHASLIITSIILLLICGCNNEKRSPIEVILLDKTVISDIRKEANSDSSYVEFPKRTDYWKIEHYIIKPNKMNLIFTDSIDNVVAYFKRIDGKNYEGAEYYANGQIMGKLNFSEPGIIDGETKYYYEDGRIRSIGLYDSDNKVGIWKNYNEQGELKSIEDFDKKDN